MRKAIDDSVGEVGGPGHAQPAVLRHRVRGLRAGIGVGVELLLGGRRRRRATASHRPTTVTGCSFVTTAEDSPVDEPARAPRSPGRRPAAAATGSPAGTSAPPTRTESPIDVWIVTLREVVGADLPASVLLRRGRTRRSPARRRASRPRGRVRAPRAAVVEVERVVGDVRARRPRTPSPRPVEVVAAFGEQARRSLAKSPSDSARR